MHDLVTWLRQQLDEDERVARETTLFDWRRVPEDEAEFDGEGRVETAEGQIVIWDHGCQLSRHIGRWSPARVLAEVDAKRRIMVIHNRRADVFPGDAGGTFDNCCDGCGYEGICDDPVTGDVNDCPILRALAVPYVDRPGYRDEWRRRQPVASDPKTETFEEWRVTGKPTGNYPPYDFTWSPLLNPHLGDPEQSARGFVALVMAGGGGWDDGPHLSHRTVTVTEWEAFAP